MVQTDLDIAVYYSFITVTIKST